MVFQRRFDSECFPTLIAGERLRWFQPLVTLEVILKRLLLSVRSFALRTGEGQRGFTRLMTQKVIFQRFLFKETSATLLTRKRLLVDLHVSLQFTFPMKADVAVLTGEPLHRLRIFLFQPSSLNFTGPEFFLFSAVVRRNWKWREICTISPLLFEDFVSVVTFCVLNLFKFLPKL